MITNLNLFLKILILYLLYIVHLIMGVEGLSKLVKPVRDVKLQEFKGKRFAIDAMLELNRTFKGPVVLTNNEGEKTHHIRSLLSLILKLQTYGIHQIWVFDHDISNDSDPNEHFQYKTETLEKRRKIKQQNDEILTAKKQSLDELKEKKANMSEEAKAKYMELFGDDEENELKEIDIYQKRVDTPHRKEINDLKFMLNTLGVEWVESPITYEGEATAADLVKKGIVDYVMTTDLDALLYGAGGVIKRSGKGKDVKFFLYDLNDIIEDLEIGYEDLIKIGLCLGTDANVSGVKNIGVKTVVKKFHNAVDWNSEPYAGLIKMFSRTYDVSKLYFNNIQSVNFTKEQQLHLVEWLVNTHQFDRDRTLKQFSNALNPIVKPVKTNDKIPNIDWNSIILR